MKRRRVLLLGALAALTLGVFAFWPRGPREPVYQGKRLSEWLQGKVNAPSAFEGQTGNRRLEAVRQAIQAIGTNAVPWLLSEFTRPGSEWRLAFNQWAQKHPYVSFRFEKNTYSGARPAADGLCLLGLDAASALPTLAKYLGDPRLYDDATRAMSACGESALPYFIQSLASTNPLVVSSAAVGLGNLSRQFDSAIPPLIQTLQHRDAGPRLAAADGLGRTSIRPELVIPALVRALSDSEAGVRRDATDGLVRLSKFSHLAVPELVRLRTNAHPATALAASNVLHTISLATLQHLR